MKIIIKEAKIEVWSEQKKNVYVKRKRKNLNLELYEARELKVHARKMIKYVKGASQSDERDEKFFPHQPQFSLCCYDLQELHICVHWVVYTRW